ncbi:MAG: response regulator transcription factor [Planctomycetota bacterium]|nr:response regulator transcription factor [Planctomycetota bacterium]
MQKEKVVVIEDDPDILEVMNYNLSREGYRVTCEQDGLEGMQRIRKENPDLVLLDLMLPGIEGTEVCRLLKLDPVTRAIPIIMVTAKGEESDIVLGLGLGADDYVCKPFSPKELIARVKAVLRRGSLKEDAASQRRMVRDGVVIDADRHEVLVDRDPVTFTATEFRLLHFMASHPGRAFTRDHLLSRVMGEDVMVYDRNIDVHVKAVRQKLGKYRELIETIRGIGYRFRDVRD